MFLLFLFFVCYRFYADDGEDVVLIYVSQKQTFYCMDAACSHEGTNVYCESIIIYKWSANIGDYMFHNKKI
jgi:nitrite reductase/ring-hydroxylating ferredoxin subunit